MKTVRLLKNDIDPDEFYDSFCKDQLHLDFLSDHYVELQGSIPDFPVYHKTNDNLVRWEMMTQTCEVILDYFDGVDHLHLFDKNFWQSFLCYHKREYLVTTYPSILEKRSAFNNVVTKKFDWENYIYKSLLAAQYAKDVGLNHEQRLEFYDTLSKNMDFYNYIIKYETFRNGPFIVNLFKVIEKHQLGDEFKKKVPLEMKAQIQEEMGTKNNDLRIGRMVIYEMDKIYPAVMYPMLDEISLEKEVLELYTKYRR